MCYSALTCNVEIYGYIFLSCWNERKTKISYSLVFQKEKIYRYLWDVFLMLWTLLGLGRDKVSPRLTHDWFVCSTSIWTSNGLGFLGHISLTIFEKFLFYVVQYNINLHCKDTKSGKCCNICKKKKKCTIFTTFSV